jgi:hypothetical protein
MNTTIGTSQTSVALTTNATLSAQNYYFTRFVSEELSGGITSIAANTWTLNIATQQSSASARFPTTNGSKVYATCYVWRPSTSSKIGDIFDGQNISAITVSTTTEVSRHLTYTGAAVAGVQDGDVICYEAFFQVTQTAASAFTDTVFYDGTTVTTTNNTAVSSHASFLETPQTLTFGAALTRVSATFTYKYSITTRVSLTSTYKYAILSRVSLTRIYKYAIVGRVSLTRTYRYSILSRVSLLRTYMYAIRARISLTTIYKYAILSRVSRTFIYKYNIASLTSVGPKTFHSLSRTHDILPFTLGLISRTLEETVTVSDGLTLQKFVSREIAEPLITVSDVPRAGKARVLQLNETVRLTQQQSFSLSSFTSTGLISFTEDSATTASFMSSPDIPSFTTESWETDVLSRAVLKLRSIADEPSIAVSDTPTIGKKAVPTLIESVTVTDSLTRQKTVPRSIFETVGLDEDIDRQLLKFRSFIAFEAVTVSDALTRSLVKPRTITESISISAIATAAVQISRTLSETVTVTGTPSKSVQKSRQLIEPTITVSASTAITKGALLQIAESIAIGESLTRQASKIRTITENIITVSAALQRTKIANRALSQSISISEALSRLRYKLLTITESPITVTGSPAFEVAVILSITEPPITVSEILSRSVTHIVQTWVLTGQATDFTDKLDNMVKTYILERWASSLDIIGSLTAESFSPPSFETASTAESSELPVPPVTTTTFVGGKAGGRAMAFDNTTTEPSISEALHVDNYTYDNFRNYYIKIIEGKTNVLNHQPRQRVCAFETPIEFHCTARRLTKGEAFRQLNNIINELLRILGHYQAEEMFGIQGITLEHITPLGNDVAHKTIWSRVLEARLHFFKAHIGVIG